MCASPSFEPCSDSEDGSLDDSHHVWKLRWKNFARYISLGSNKSCCVMWNLGSWLQRAAHSWTCLAVDGVWSS